MFQGPCGDKFSQSSQKPLEGSATISLVLQPRKLRHKAAHRGHRASDCDSNSLHLARNLSPPKGARRHEQWLLEGQSVTSFGINLRHSRPTCLRHHAFRMMTRLVTTDSKLCQSRTSATAFPPSESLLISTLFWAVLP